MYNTYAGTIEVQQTIPRPILGGRSRTQVKPAAPRGLLIAAASFLFAVLVAQVTLRVAIIGQGYELEATRQATMEQDQRLRQYKLHYAWLTSPQRLTSKAQQELQMIPLKPQQIRKM